MKYTVKKPDFGRFISNGLKVDYDNVANVAKITQNISVQMADRMDDAVIEAIEKAAKEAGITHLFIINKKSVMDALEKQIPKKVEIKITGSTGWNTTTYCPACKKEVLSGNYCIHCGQALKWNEVQEE